jgi:hypothetical protein
MGEFEESATNEANFDETMSSVEPQESIQVTANSGAFSGLDNGVAQPGEGGTPEPGKRQGSAPASGNPKPQAADSRVRPRSAVVGRRRLWFSCGRMGEALHSRLEPTAKTQSELDGRLLS